MKKLLLPLTLLLALCVSGCNIQPSIEKVEESSRDTVEQLLTEDNREDVYLRMDRYFLSEKQDLLTYVGTVKATLFYKDTDWDWKRHEYVDKIDSIKLYRKVVVKFRDKKYNHYTVTIKEED